MDGQKAAHGDPFDAEENQEPPSTVPQSSKKDQFAADTLAQVQTVEQDLSSKV